MSDNDLHKLDLERASWPYTEFEKSVFLAIAGEDGEQIGVPDPWDFPARELRITAQTPHSDAIFQEAASRAKQSLITAGLVQRVVHWEITPKGKGHLAVILKEKPEGD